MYGDPVFYSWMTFTEALSLDKSSECITEPLHGVRGSRRMFGASVCLLVFSIKFVFIFP